MTRVKRVHEFFKTIIVEKPYEPAKDIYGCLQDFAVSPYTWHLPHSKGSGVGGMASGVGAIFMDIALKIILTPVLLPALAITASLALIGTAMVAIAHGLALAGAAAIDAISPESELQPVI